MIFGLFLSNTEFSSKFWSNQFLLIPTQYHCAKLKKTNEQIPYNIGSRRMH